MWMLPAPDNPLALRQAIDLTTWDSLLLLPRPPPELAQGVGHLRKGQEPGNAFLTKQTHTHTTSKMTVASTSFLF